MIFTQRPLRHDIKFSLVNDWCQSQGLKFNFRGPAIYLQWSFPITTAFTQLKFLIHYYFFSKQVYFNLTSCYQHGCFFPNRPLTFLERKTKNKTKELAAHASITAMETLQWRYTERDGAQITKIIYIFVKTLKKTQLNWNINVEVFC